MRASIRTSIGVAVALLVLTGCEPAPTATFPPKDDGLRLSASSAPGAPTAVPFSVTIPVDDPCTGVVDPNEMLATVAGTSFVHSLPNGNVVAHLKRTITTDTGYEGGGEATEITNDNVMQTQWNDIVTHPDGRAIRSHFVSVLDLTTSPPTVRVQMGPELVCFKR